MAAAGLVSVASPPWGYACAYLRTSQVPPRNMGQSFYQGSYDVGHGTHPQEVMHGVLARGMQTRAPNHLI